MLRKLSVLPERFNEMKRSSARARAVTALSRAKAWFPELDSADISIGYPSLKEDGPPFTAEDFTKIVREMRPFSGKLVEESELSKY